MSVSFSFTHISGIHIRLFFPLRKFVIFASGWSCRHWSQSKKSSWCVQRVFGSDECRFNDFSLSLRKAFLQTGCSRPVWYLSVRLHLHTWATNALTRAPLALQVFHHLLGGGGGVVFEHPLYLGSYWSQRKTEKSVRKLVKNDYETNSVNFSLKSKLWPPG